MADQDDTSVYANKQFFVIGLIFQIVMIVLYGVFVKYADVADAEAGVTDPQFSARYPLFQDVHVMIFVGFGFLMTFLQKYGFSAVGFNLMIAAFIIEWSMLVNGFWHNVHLGEWHKIELSLESLIGGDFAAGAVLITYGAVIGKVSPAQLLVIGILEIVAYSLNEMIGIQEMEAVDIGGSMIIHSFGAYFGIACALVLGPAKLRSEYPEGHPKNSSNKTSDTFAMIGTVFLWMFWPSFNGALGNGNQQHRVIINTVLSLCGSCVATFLLSPMLRRDPGNRFNMVDVQNATLAGGVAIGASADLMTNPFGAMIIGTFSGAVSVFGYTRVQPFLQQTLKLHDTCGVHNLHGLPGVVGGISSIIVARFADRGDYGANLEVIFPALEDRSVADQSVAQVAVLGVTLGIALASGALTGFIVKLPLFAPHDPELLYDDHQFWTIEEEEQGDERLLDNPGRMRSPRGVDNVVYPTKHGQSTSPGATTSPEY